MKKIILLPITLIVAMLFLATTACAHPTPKADEGTEMAVTDMSTFLADTIEVKSQAMGRTIKNVVIKPEYYITYNQNARFPVLYLLHGAYGCYSDWSKKTDLHRLADKYHVIIVCPDGQDSWYFDSPVDPKMQFETYVSKELVAYVDSHYRTHANRCMRAITGLSMGGHGALFLAFRHPDVFWSCGSMSGNMDITQFPDKWHIKDRWATMRVTRSDGGNMPCATSSIW
jgi:S-formylglutathione hydrolase FrmB